MAYLERAIDGDLRDHLDAFGAVLIEGPKWCGKTTTAKQVARSVLELQDPDYREEYMTTARTKPSLLLDGAAPRLIDEWQDAPALWDAVRVAVDRRQLTGQFILTGSTSVDDRNILHTGTGRIARMQMYPMSLYESKESNGTVSLRGLFDDREADIDGRRSDLTIEDLIFAACRGGWPASLNAGSDRGRLLVARDYFNTVCSNDISKVDGVEKNPAAARRILRSYARNVSTLAKKSTILSDAAVGQDSLARSTFDVYVEALERLFVIRDIEAWNPSIRSATAVRSGEKRGLCDPSIAVAALGLSPDVLKTSLKTFGFIFECMCIRDIRAYSQGLDGEISYYRDRYGLEADAVLHLSDGRYALMEFKLGSGEIEEGASHLTELAGLIRQHNASEKQVPIREPDLLMVVTGGQMAYTRPDGVKVVPLGCLKW